MKNIVIINDCGYYVDKTPFLLTDGTIELSAALPAVSGEFYFVAKNNGVQTAKILLSKDQRFEVKSLKPGTLTATIKHYLRGELIEIYPVETLVLKDVDGKVYGVPYIEALKEQLDAAVKRIVNLEQTNTTLTEAIRKIHLRLKNLEKLNEGD